MTSRIVYSSPFVPAEWIAAHGLAPCRILPDRLDRDGPVAPQAGQCAFMRGTVNEMLEMDGVAGIVLATGCDQMRRAADLILPDPRRPVFLMNVPATWQTPAAHRLYLAEIRRLGRFLVALGGAVPSMEHLARTMDGYERERENLSALRPNLGGRAFAEALADFHLAGRRGQGCVILDLCSAVAGDGDHPVGKRSPESAMNEALEGHGPPCPPAQESRMTQPWERAATGIPIGVVGGPLARRDLVLFDLIEEAGGQVALDGTETGERTLPARFDRRRLREDPLLELAEAYFGALPDAFRRPNSALYRWLRDKIRERGARGLILTRCPWCDIWHAEVARMREWLDIPLLDLDLGSETPSARNGNRIKAFMETLR